MEWKQRQQQQQLQPAYKLCCDMFDLVVLIFNTLVDRMKLDYSVSCLAWYILQLHTC